MKKTQFTRNLLATTMICGSIGIATPAFAQADQPAPSAPANGQPADEEGQAIVVTGSRIPQPNLTGASPITVVNSQDVRQTGTTRAEDLVNSLPQVFAAQGSNIANGATGTATLDLRGLGSVRTLVLLNGRRLLPGDPGSSAADINAIPAALIDRVDVLTGGASSVYGADAVAGVVNFILDTHFEGIRVDSQYSFYQHENGTSSDIIRGLNARNFGYPTGNVADGGTWDSTIAMGTSFSDNRGHITGYFGYRHIDPVLQARRDYSACSAQASTPTQVAGGQPRLACGGSATSANGTVIVYDHGTSTIYQFGPNRTLIPGSTAYNFGPLNHFQRPDERYTGGVFADYEISPALHPYLEFMFMDDRTVAQIAPSGDFGNTLVTNCDNPLMSAQQRSIVCDPTDNIINGFLGNFPLTPFTNPGPAPITFFDPTTGTPYNEGFFQLLRRNVEGGPRQDDLQHVEYRGVVGMRGDLSSAWSYDLYYQYGRTNFSETYRNEFSAARLARALDVVPNPAVNGVAGVAAGAPVCRSAIPGTPSGDPNCVPFDVFGGAGAVSQAAVNYLNVSGFQRGVVDERVANASITGDLGSYGLRFPWAESGVGIAAGVEYRKEQLNFVSDLEFSTGDLTGQGAATLPVSGSFDVREAFGEIRIPIAEHNFIDELTLTGGYRYSDYKVGGGGSFNTDTYKLQLEFAPVHDIRFRGGYNRAVRAPNIQELFAPQRVALDGSTDPCAGRVLTAADTGCIAQGLRVGQRVAANPAGQYNGLIGGNRNLSPEIADTWTAGVVVQPRFIPGLAFSVDYFDIKIKDTITTIGADTILSVCGSTLDPGICGLIHRNPVTGSLWLTPDGYVQDLARNIGSLRTKGLDINASYSHGIGSWGRLGLNFVGTYLIDLVTNTGVSVPYDCTGLYGNVCGVPTPEWRHQARLTWTGPSGIGASLRWRYFGPVRQDQSSSNVNLNGNTTPQNARIPAQSYFDLALTFRVTDHYSFRLGANNILDREPPLVGSARSGSFGGGACPAGSCNGNTFAQVYDALGRYIYAGVTLDF